MIDLTKEALLTVGGVATFVLIVTQLLKRVIKTYEERGWHDIVLTVGSVVLGVGAALFAKAAVGPIEYASAFDAVLVGLSGAAVAVFGYEGIKNTLSYINSK